MARHTRRQALRLGLLGAAPILASPAIRRLLDGSSDLAGSAGSHQHHSRYRSLAKAPASPAVTPFQVQLPVPPVLDASASFTPACELDPAWGPPTFREITMRKATVEIIPGLGTEIYGYNGLYPGPTIRARKGSPVAVRFRNDLDVDTCVHNHGGHQAGKFLGNTLKGLGQLPERPHLPGRARMDPRARAYVERRRAEGRTYRDAVRALKRHLSDAVYRQLREDAERARHSCTYGVPLT